MSVIVPKAHSILKTAAILLLVDLFWLATGGIFARQMTQRIQGHPIEFRYLSAVVVYLVMAYMLLQVTSYKQAFMYGVSIYAVYDFTNYALLTNYDLKFAIADTLWGGILFTVAFHLLKAF